MDELLKNDPEYNEWLDMLAAQARESE